MSSHCPKLTKIMEQNVFFVALILSLIVIRSDQFCPGGGGSTNHNQLHHHNPRLVLPHTKTTRASRDKGIIVCHLSSSSSASSNNNNNNNNNQEEKPSSAVVLCVGETLWDCLPDGNCYLGGAPTNVAVHLASLGRDTNVAMMSCIGRDELGDETIQRLKARNVRTEYVQRHETLSTGKVVATIDPSTGDATYKFDTPSAWDNLQFRTENREELLSSAGVVVMGSIASRLSLSDYDASSASTILRLRQEAPEDSVVFDVNLRPPWYNPSEVLKLARGGCSRGGGGSSSGDHDEQHHPLALVKVNEEELAIMEDWLRDEKEKNIHNDAITTKTKTTSTAEDDSNNSKNSVLRGEGLQRRMRAFGKALNANRVCVTRGEHGAALWCQGTKKDGGDDDNDEDDVFVEHDGFPAATFRNGEKSDTIGAGDSFLAALVRSLLVEKEPPHLALTRGCALGGYVASCRGATPKHEDAPSEIKQVFSFGGN